MAKEDNLIPFNKMSQSKRSEIARKGAIASNKVQKEKKTFKMALKELLEEEVMKDGKPTGKTYQDLVNIGLVKGAMKGNAINYKTILETIGELEAEKTEVSVPTIKLEVVDNSKLERVLYDNKEYIPQQQSYL